MIKRDNSIVLQVIEDHIESILNETMPIRAAGTSGMPENKEIIKVVNKLLNSDEMREKMRVKLLDVANRQMREILKGNRIMALKYLEMANKPKEPILLPLMSNSLCGHERPDTMQCPEDTHTVFTYKGTQYMFGYTDYHCPQCNKRLIKDAIRYIEEEL